MDFSEDFKNILKTANLYSSAYITPEHLYYGILKNKNCFAYTALSQVCDTESIEHQLDIYYMKNTHSVSDRPLSVSADNIITECVLLAKKENSVKVDSVHLLRTLVKAKIIEIEQIDKLLEQIDNNMDDLQSNNGEDSKGKVNSNSKTPTLDEFTTDFTDLAKKGLLDPVVGRENELRRVAQVLSRRKKNNPVLIGEPGVGKTAVVENLAQNIINRNVPTTLFDKKILAIEMANLVAGTKYRGEFEDRMKKIIKELKDTPDVIIYIDEIHTMVGAGGSGGSLDASNILKPALARGEISCIGATTFDEYKEIEKDGALDRRFQKVIINEPTLDETRIILDNIKPKYEEFHGVNYNSDVIDECLKLSERYLTERNFPDKAIDVLDEVGSSLKINKKIPFEVVELETKLQEISERKMDKVKKQDFEGAAEERALETEVTKKLKIQRDIFENGTDNRQDVTVEMISDVISTMTGIPSSNISSDDIDRAINLQRILKNDVIGQDEPVKLISECVLRNKAGINDRNRPIGTFLFLGPTGVGKTYLAKRLAKQLFNSEDDMVRIDMSEYMEKHTVSRLIGSPPGYVGYDEGGQLTDAVSRKPFSVILLDEVEKAHKDVWNILLQVFDDGMLTDSKGKKINFKNTIIIMTSNAGSREAKDRGPGIGFNTDKKTLSDSIIDKTLKKMFAPEFLNRIDEIVKFNSLGKDDIKKIINIELDVFADRLKEVGVDIELDEKAIDFLIEKGWDEDMGARPIKRAIQKYIENKISIKIITKEYRANDTIRGTVSEDGEELTFDVVNRNPELIAGSISTDE